MIISVVIENKSYIEEMNAHYGLSLLVETKANRFLVDCGQNEETFQNFNQLGYDVSDIDKIVISHNHFDHIKGLSAFLEKKESMQVVASADANIPLYTKRWWIKRKVSCNDFFETYGNNFVLVEDEYQLFDNVFVCRVKQPQKRYMCKDSKLKELDSVSGKLINDRFEHEVYIAVIEGDECKIISSCSHNGIVNIVNDAKRRFPNLRTTTFVGGLHLRGEHHNSLNCSKRLVKEMIEVAEDLGISTIRTGHCTGEKAYRIIKQSSKVDIEYFSAGVTFTV